MLTEATMRRIVLLWLILTPIWIAFSFYASASKIAFVPPALAVIAVVLHWLHKHFVVAVAGEPEPRRRPVAANLGPSPNVSRVARPSRSLLRPALIAVGIGACFGGAAMAFVHSHRQAADATGATQANAISVQTEAVNPQSSTAQARPVQTEAVKSQSPAATAKIPENAAPNSSLGADARRADAQVQETSSPPPRCNVSLCESSINHFARRIAATSRIPGRGNIAGGKRSQGLRALTNKIRSASPW
jgi:hypothetical protein